MFPRLLEPVIRSWLDRKKAIILIGPRQVGKTTLIEQITTRLGRDTMWLTGDDPATRTLLENISLARLKAVIGQQEVVVVDEAQRLHNAGLTLKLITDHLPNVQLLVTGSSSLDLAAEIKESLVGRKREFRLFPLSFVEMSDYHGYLAERSLLEHRMIFGYYPEVVKSDLRHAQNVLADLSDGLMYKDLLALDQIKKPSLLVKLLQALALQLGNEVSYNEVAQLVGADPQTIERYIDLLEQTFVLFRLPSISRNARNEIKKGRKIYFYDNGIRNSIIKNFNPLDLRQDTGALWENFLLAERRKRNSYTDLNYNSFFWRTTTQQEIDYVEEFDGKLHAFEFKWRVGKVRVPQSFIKAYPNSEFSVITPENFDDFIGQEDRPPTATTP
ncbi:MAG: ATP-binding protein [Saprospiraceae bacterium]|nr:ATP-binding protein [Saprospiraceae bacterium]MCB0624304.1 ATP-binding protein [Saprospiraceae bacterium]MCB0677575.1 ATP-binding protein [Saprospiraceae bacterium]MCB0680395.1 ATP-binding protein [Saprospiraceae bacterium]